MLIKSLKKVLIYLSKHQLLVWLFLLFSLIVCRIWLYNSRSFDEGIYLIIPKLMNQGLTIYKDFWVDKPPIMFFLIGLGQKVFGATIWGNYLWYTLINSIVAFLIFKVTGAYTRSVRIGFAGAMFWVIFSSLPLAELFFIMSEPYVVLFGLLAIWFFIKSQQGKNYFFISDEQKTIAQTLPSRGEKLFLMLSGFSLVLTFLIRPTGIIFILAFLVFIIIEKKQFPTKQLIYLAIGLLLALALLFAYLIINSDFRGYLYQVYLERYSFLSQTANSRFVYKINWFGNYFFSSLPLWLLAIPTLKEIRKNRWLILFWGWLLLTIAFYFFFNFAPGFGHEYAETITPLSIIAAWGMYIIWRQGSLRFKRFYIIGLVIAILISLICNYRWGEWRNNDVPFLNEVSSYLKSTNSQGNHFFVLETKHRKVTPWLYFLNDGPPFLHNRLSFQTPIEGMYPEESEFLISKLDDPTITTVVLIGGAPPAYPQFKEINQVYLKIINNFRIEKSLSSYSPYPGRLDNLEVDILKRINLDDYAISQPIDLNHFAGSKMITSQNTLEVNYLPLESFTLYDKFEDLFNFEDVFLSFELNFDQKIDQFYLDLVDGNGGFARKVLSYTPGDDQFDLYISKISMASQGNKATDFSRIKQINLVIPKQTNEGKLTISNLELKTRSPL